MRLPNLDLLRLHWDRVVAVGCLLLGVLALILGYVGVSRTAYTAEQVPYVISGGITGLLLLGIAATLYLSADLRDEWRKLDEFHRDLTALQEPAPSEDLKATLVTLQRRIAALEAGADPTAEPGPAMNGSAAPRSRRQSPAGRRG